MITRIAVQNFRRHAHTDIAFGPSDGLIAITGNNGMGKSTLVGEALLFAFFGESRHGRRQLDNLVMRGAELVGCEVVVEFVVADQEYRVERRRVERVSSAVLYSGGVPIASSPGAVDAEMSRLLGMDAAGFKLAVLAKQKELDGLVALDRRTRKLQVGRLLRLDAIASAAAEAAKRYSDALALTRALGGRVDLAPLAGDLADAQASLASLATLVAGTRAELDDLDAAVSRSAPILDAYNAAVASHQAAAGALGEAGRNAAAQAARAAQLAPPSPPPPPARPSEQVREQLAVVRDAIAEAKNAAQVAADLDLLAADLASCETDLAAREQLNAEADIAERDLVAAAEAQAAAARELADATIALEAARDSRATAAAGVATAASALAAASSLEAMCASCGQQVSDEYRLAQLAQAEQASALAASAADAAAAAALAAEEQVGIAKVSYDRASGVCAALERTVAARDVDAHTELVRRRNAYLFRLSRPRPDAGDLAALTAEQSQLTAELNSALAAERALADHATQQARHDSAVLAATEAAERVLSAQALVEVSRPAESLAEAAEAALAELARRNELVVALGGLAESVELAERAVRACQARLADAEAHNTRIETVTGDAHAWAVTKSVLSDTHSSLSAASRPALAAALSSLLARLSDGRFEAVTVDEDFEVKVLDGGAYRSLADLSGGETDLVALALRLALARLIGESADSAGMGVLVLDEVFGSQDPSRRTAILESLRELRGDYGQIFIISHVGGLEEAADKVIDIATDDGLSAAVTVIG